MVHVSLSSSKLIDFCQSVMLHHQLFNAWIHGFFCQYYDSLQSKDTDVTHWMVQLLRDLVRMAEAPTVLKAIHLKASTYSIAIGGENFISFPVVASKAYKVIADVYIYFWTAITWWFHILYDTLHCYCSQFLSIILKVTLTHFIDFLLLPCVWDVYVNPSYHLTPRGLSTTTLCPKHWNIMYGLRISIYAYDPNSQTDTSIIILPCWAECFTGLVTGLQTLFSRIAWFQIPPCSCSSCLQT